MGRPRKPTAQHELDGTYREDRHGGEPDYPEGAPPMPASVEALPAAASYWDFYVEEMTTVGTLSVVDGAVLAHLCILRAIEEDLVTQLVNAKTMTVAEDVRLRGGDDDSMTPAKAVALNVHPLAKELRALTAAIRGCSADLGLTPVSRGRAGTTGTKPKGNDGKPASRIAQLQAAGRQLRAV
jgi:hypothetical protein